MMARLFRMDRPFLPAAALLLFLVLASPSVIGAGEYRMAWDDLYLFHRSLCFHNAVYDLNFREMVSCYSIVSKSPILTLMTLPWGSAARGEAAVPLALIGLAVLIWLIAVLSYYAATSAGSSPWLVALAALAIWWNPAVTGYGGAFLSDILLGWITLLLLLLIPLELRTKSRGLTDDLARGALWGFVVTVGALTKVTFGLFLVVAGPIVIGMRARNVGWRSCRNSTLAAFVCALPAIVIWAAFGRNFLAHAANFSFGGLSKFYATGARGPIGNLQHYGSECSKALLPTAAAAVYFIWNWRRADHRVLRLFPAGLALLYLGLCAISPNQDIRFAIPVMIALPVALAVVPTRQAAAAIPSPAAFCLALLVATLASVPMLARPNLTYVRYAEAVLDKIGRPGVTILLATDDPFLNIETFLLAKEIRRPPGIGLDTLVYDTVRGLTLDASYRRLESADYILFRKPPLSSDPEWSNRYAKAFRQRTIGIADPVEAPSEFMEVFKIRR